MDERKIVKCKGCGADIFFLQGIPWYAKKVPVLIEEGPNNEPGIGPVVKYTRTTGYLIAVSHFINCRKAADFSKNRKPAPPIIRPRIEFDDGSEAKS